MNKLLLIFIFPIVFACNVMAQTENLNQEVNAPNQKIDSNQVFTAVQIEPSFPGGQAKFDKYIAKNQQSMESPNNTNGMVFAQFIVERDSTLSHIQILRSQSDVLSAEALRLLKQSPPWNPGKQNGKAVRVKYTIPIRFKIN